MKKRFFFLYITTITVVLLITVTSIYLFYSNNVKNSKIIVFEMLRNQVSVIQSVYISTQDVVETKHIIENSHLLDNNVDVSFEFTIGEKKNDSICFFSGLRKSSLNNSISIPVNSDNAIPMQLALKGGKGEITGKDYVGDEVFAAYEYLPDLKWGVVSKVDLGDIRKSFIGFSLIIITIGLILVFISSYILSKYTVKIDNEIRGNEIKYRKIFENANDGIFLFDKNGNYIDVNNAGCTLLGYSKEEVLKMNLKDIIYSSDVESVLLKMDDFESGETTLTRRELRNKDGVVIPVEISGSLLHDGKILGIVRNIEERLKYENQLKTQNEEIQSQNEEINQQNEEYKQINDELMISKLKIQESEARFRSTFDQSPIGAAMVDMNHVFINCNASFCRFLGFEQYELIGKTISDMIYSEDVDLGMQEMKELMEEKRELFTVQKRYLCKNGQVVWGEITTSLVRGLNNEPLYFISIIQDIHEKKIAEMLIKEKTEEIENQNEEYKQINEEYKQINEELFISRQKAEESDKLKSAFLANMSHEIRTPMNGIIGFADLLNNPNLTEKKRHEYTKIIIERSQQLLSVVSDILDISKIEAGLVSVKNESISINELLSELWIFYSNNQKIKDIKLEKKFGLEGISNFISADKTKITQVLNNLLNNAIKFTCKGKIAFGYEHKGNELEFFVEDTGIGIPDCYKDKMFKRFSQVEEQMTKNYGGTGLGLAISKELVEIMGGRIWIETKVGSGTKVFFTVPYVPLDSEGEGQLEQSKIMYNKKISGKHVLIVDDDDINLLYLKELLTSFELSVFEAVNGVEAVEQFRNNREIAMVLMDLKMPLMNGIEATKLIKSLDVKVKIVAQTSYAMYTEKEMALKEGCDDYISKPLNKEKLLDLLNKYL